MRVMLMSFAVMVAISVGAFYGLHEAGFSSADQLAGPAVRLD